MSRYVDLDERVIAQFYDEEFEEWTMQTVTIEDVLDSVCDEFTVLPSAQPKQRWTPVTEGLPKKDGDYYVTITDGQTARWFFLKGISEEYWTRSATAWMPLPEPYKGDANG